MGKWLYFIFLAFALNSCVNPNGLSPASEKETIDEARRALEQYYQDINSKGLLSEFNWLDSSSSFFWLPPGYAGPIHFDSVAKIIRSNALAMKKIEESWEELHLFALSNKYVSFSGRLKSISTDTSGVNYSVRLVETGILVKREGGWKLLCGQTSLYSSGYSNH